MTTIAYVEKKCAVCKAVHEYIALSSTNAFGSPDLDLRPPEMQRSTMSYWVQECPECGYAAYKVSDPCMIDAAFLKREEYVSCEGIGFVSDLAKTFYRQYMISLQEGRIKDAFFAALHAAWACDDEPDVKNAEKCRLLSIPLITDLIDKNDAEKENLLLIKADLLRRTRRFNELIAEYRNVRFESETLNKVIAFQIEKAQAEDPYCYRVSDAVKDRS